MKINTMLILFLFWRSISFTQVLDPDWKQSVVVIDQKIENRFEATATGFGITFGNVGYILTNKHVILMPNLYIRCNSKNHNSSSIELSIDSIAMSAGIPLAISPDADIAAIPLLQYESMVKQSDSLEIKLIGISLFKEWDYLNEGDEIFLLGFPMQIGSGTRSQPVYRTGIVALKEKQGQFLIDCKVYPGNSGGPVFMKPSYFNYRTNDFGKVMPGYLVGIVSSYIPYTDIAVSLQTQRPRVTFEENSGLATVFSAEKIKELLSSYSQKYKLGK